VTQGDTEGWGIAVYNPARLRPGDIILVHGKPGWSLSGLLDAAIEWSTISPFSHAAMVGSDADGLCIYEALWHVTKSPITKYVSSGTVFSVADATDAERAAAAAWAAERVGIRYGLKELLEDGGRYVLHIPLVHRAFPRHFTCSMLVAYAWAVGADVVLTYEPLPSPASLSYSPLLVGPRPWRPQPAAVNNP
jgi:hypothetical protein